MGIQTLRCNNCGANLKINPTVKFFKCSFCGSSLTIKNTGNISYTEEVLDDIKENTNTLVDNSEVILIEKEVARLDREWIIEREKYKIKGRHSSSLPDGSTAIKTVIGLIFGLGFMSFWLKKVSSFGNAPPFFIPFGILFVFVLIFYTISNLSKSSRYHSAKKRYLDQRSDLLNKIKK